MVAPVRLFAALRAALQLLFTPLTLMNSVSRFNPLHTLQQVFPSALSMIPMCFLLTWMFERVSAVREADELWDPEEKPVDSGPEAAVSKSKKSSINQRSIIKVQQQGDISHPPRRESAGGGRG